MKVNLIINITLFGDILAGSNVWYLSLGISCCGSRCCCCCCWGWFSLL